MKIIFVGVHNNEGFDPLDSRSLSGKRIDRVITNFPAIECVKTNLFDCTYLPKDHTERAEHLYNWVKKYNPSDDDIIVLLGIEAAKGFYYELLKRKNVIQFWHPSPKNFATRSIDYVGTLTKMLHNVLNVQASVATDADSSNIDDNQNK